MSAALQEDPVRDFRRHEIASLLRKRRRELRPEDVGLPCASRRRKSGLRMEDVAELANVSLSWYAHFEAGQAITVSPKTVDAIARVLQLSPYERAHLFAVTGTPMPPSPREDPKNPLADIRAIVQAFAAGPAIAIDHRYDLLATNHLACRLFDLSGTETGFSRNCVWRVFAVPRYREIGGPDWDAQAERMVDNLRRRFAQHPDDAYLQDLIRELWSSRPEFARFWNLPLLQPPLGSRFYLRARDGERAAFDASVISASSEQHPNINLCYFVFHDPRAIALLN